MDALTIRNLTILGLVFLAFNRVRSDGASSDWYRSNSKEDHYGTGGFLRVCTNAGDVFETVAVNCPSGVFLKEPMVPGCVCMKGTWILHSTLCDTAPYIFHAATVECYQIDFNISIFVHLGDTHNVNKSRIYVAPYTMMAFYEITEGVKTPLIKFHWPTIFGLHPNKAILAHTEGRMLPVCFSQIEYIPPTGNVNIHLWDGARGPTSYELVDSCEGSSSTGGGYDTVIDNFYYLPYRPCLNKCESQSSGGGTDPLGSGTVVSGDTARDKRSLRDQFLSDWNSWNFEVREGSSESRRRSSGETLKRSKRYETRDTVESTWDGLGFCMKAYWDPLLKFEMITVEDHRCFPETEEWLVKSTSNERHRKYD